MGAFFEMIPESLVQWVLEQKVFWVASAPLSAAGHVNVSPKGGPYFGLLDRQTFWYMELTGSGNETVSHLYEPGNGRITVQFNAFEGPPRILRMYGHGRVLENDNDQGEEGKGEFARFVRENKIKTIPGTRSIIVVDIHQVGTSCGYSVPFYDFKEFRGTLNEHFRKLNDKYMEGDETKSMPRYWALKNAWSNDGLPGLNVGQETMKKVGIKPLKKMSGPGTMSQYRMDNNKGALGMHHLLLVAVTSALLTAVLILYGSRILQVLDGFLAQDVRSFITAPLATLR